MIIDCMLQDIDKRSPVVIRTFTPTPVKHKMREMRSKEDATARRRSRGSHLPFFLVFHPLHNYRSHYRSATRINC